MVSSQSRTRWCWKRIRVDSRATSGKWRCGQKKFHGVCRTPLWGGADQSGKAVSFLVFCVKYIILLLWEYEREGKREREVKEERGVREGRREEKERTKRWILGWDFVPGAVSYLSIRVNEGGVFVFFLLEFSSLLSCLGRKPPSGLPIPLLFCFLPSWFCLFHS